MTAYETVLEYNAAKDLLIVQNSRLTEPTEHEVLGKSGWIEVPLDEAGDIPPPTPRHHRCVESSVLKDSWSRELKEGSAQIDDLEDATISLTTGKT